MAIWYLFTEEEAKDWREMRAEWRKRRLGGVPVTQSHGNRAPTVYVAKIPASGLGPLTKGTSPDPDIPGAALCQIYEVRPTQVEGVVELYEITGYQEWVYNVSEVTIDSAYAVIKREAFGHFVYECPCVGYLTGTGTTGTGTTGTGTSTGTGTGQTGTGTGTGPCTLDNCVWTCVEQAPFFVWESADEMQCQDIIGTAGLCLCVSPNPADCNAGTVGNQDSTVCEQA